MIARLLGDGRENLRSRLPTAAARDQARKPEIVGLEPLEQVGGPQANFGVVGERGGFEGPAAFGADFFQCVARLEAIAIRFGAELPDQPGDANLTVVGRSLGSRRGQAGDEKNRRRGKCCHDRGRQTSHRMRPGVVSRAADC